MQGVALNDVPWLIPQLVADLRSPQRIALTGDRQAAFQRVTVEAAQASLGQLATHQMKFGGSLRHRILWAWCKPGTQERLLALSFGVDCGELFLPHLLAVLGEQIHRGDDGDVVFRHHVGKRHAEAEVRIVGATIKPGGNEA
jgi:hypothetical protein